MSITGMALRRPHALSQTVLLVSVPLLFLCTGIFIRWLAYAGGAPEPTLDGYVSALCRWDCGWYLGLAEHGYEPFPMQEGRVVGSWGFFPLYPAVVSAVRNLFGLPTLHSALAVSTICSFAACLLAWPLLERNHRAYVLYCAFVLSGPFSFHNMTGLTEGLTLLLTTLVFVALRRSAWLAAGIATALLSATRLVGVFAVLALLVDMYDDHRRGGGGIASFMRQVLSRPDLLLAIAISPAGLFSYMLVLYVTVGDGLAFGHVQRAFGRVLGNPAMFLWYNLSHTPAAGWWPTPHQWSGLTVIIGLCLCAVLAFRRQYGAAVFCTVCIVLPISSGLASIVRYVAALVPLTTTLMGLLAERWLFLPSLLVILTGCYFVTAACSEDILRWYDASRPRRAKLAAYLPAAALFAAEAVILLLALTPDVPPDYRAFYIDRSTTCLNREVAGTYRLGETVSFRSDGAKAAAPLKVCGWTGAVGNGTHSRGHTSRLRIALADPPPAGGLTATVELAPVVRPGTGERQVVISVNGVEVEHVTLPSPEPRNVVFRIPPWLVGDSDRLEIRFDYPNPLSIGPMASITHDRAVRLSSLRLEPGPG